MLKLSSLRSLKLINYLDDILFILGCVCILIGLSMWSVVATWIAAGVMLICFGLLYARKMAHDVAK